MADSITEICSMASKEVGGERITSYEDDTSDIAKNCRLLYPTTKDALLESYDWPFARARAVLSAHTDSPDFQWTYQFALPGDYLVNREIFTEQDQDLEDDRQEFEGEYVMSDDSSVQIKYIRKIDDVSKFGNLFTEVLISRLALKLLTAIAGLEGAGAKRDRLKDDLVKLERKARAMYYQTTQTTGRSDWNNARNGGIV